MQDKLDTLHSTNILFIMQNEEYNDISETFKKLKVVNYYVEKLKDAIKCIENLNIDVVYIDIEIDHKENFLINLHDKFPKLDFIISKSEKNNRKLAYNDIYILPKPFDFIKFINKIHEIKTTEKENNWILFFYFIIFTSIIFQFLTSSHQNCS